MNFKWGRAVDLSACRTDNQKTRIALRARLSVTPPYHGDRVCQSYIAAKLRLAFIRQTRPTRRPARRLPCGSRLNLAAEAGKASSSSRGKPAPGPGEVGPLLGTSMRRPYGLVYRQHRSRGLGTASNTVALESTFCSCA